MFQLLAASAVLAASSAAACDGHDSQTGLGDKGAEIVTDLPGRSEAGAAEAGADVVRIRLTFGGKVVVVKMRDNSASRDLLAQLPLTLTLSDYAGTEKVATLPKKLSTQGAPGGFDPSVGDVTYYAPWGNLAIFYKDFGYASGLIPLGSIESELTDLQALDQDVTVTVERVKESPSADSEDGGAR